MQFAGEQHSVEHISVVVPTYQRPDDVRRCLASLRGVTYPQWDILLVDQSEDARTEAVARSFATDLPQLRYHRIAEKGLARARNAGIAATTGAIIAFLDDDCTVECDWLEQVAAVLQRHADAALVFGAVQASAHNTTVFFIPEIHIAHEERYDGKRAMTRITECMGASMYLRRGFLASAGAFDSQLGAGAPIFTSCEDFDYCYRVLAAGGAVVQSPSIAVRHFGARDYKSGAASRLIRDAAFSAAAVDMKLLRCGEGAAVRLIATHTYTNLTRIRLDNVVLRSGPSGLAWISMYLAGLFASFRLRVDRDLRLYRPVADATQ
jgi:GT2 family glycosyltransferase